MTLLKSRSISLVYSPHMLDYSQASFARVLRAYGPVDYMFGFLAQGHCPVFAPIQDNR